MGATVGVAGCAFTITEVDVEIQVLSAVRLTKMLCEPAGIPAKVAEDW